MFNLINDSHKNESLLDKIGTLSLAASLGVSPSMEHPMNASSNLVRFCRTSHFSHSFLFSREKD